MMNEQDAMQRAIEVMRKSKCKNGADPKVGAVLFRDGEVIAAQEHTEKGHAEYLLLIKIKARKVPAGTVLFTTLEPCSFRGVDNKQRPKTSCADLIIRKGVKRVIVGMLDPNPYILGNGIAILRQKQVEVSLFAPPFMREIEDANNQFRKANGIGASKEVEDDKLRGRWWVTTEILSGSEQPSTTEKLHLTRRIANRFYGVMYNERTKLKYDVFLVKVAQNTWDYVFRQKQRAKRLDHGGGVICFRDASTAEGFGATHGVLTASKPAPVRITLRRVR